jgi:hypothetical protein
VPGRHLPPDPSLGDENTIGGYMAVHARPAAFEGSDGLSYSVEILSGGTGEDARPGGAYFLFLRWRRVGASGIEGHLESEFLAYGESESHARARLGAMSLAEVREHLERLIRAHRGEDAPRKWWDVMRDEDVD